MYFYETKSVDSTKFVCIQLVNFASLLDFPRPQGAILFIYTPKISMMLFVQSIQSIYIYIEREYKLLQKYWVCVFR